MGSPLLECIKKIIETEEKSRKSDVIDISVKKLGLKDNLLID